MRRLLSIVVLVVAFQVGIMAQSGSEKAIMAAVEMLKTAMLDADKTKLEAITAKNLTYGHSAGKIENRAQFIEALVSGLRRCFG